jgi:hypothetical protein
MDAATVISIAKISQYLWSESISKSVFFGNVIDPHKARQLYMERKALEYAKQNVGSAIIYVGTNPFDPTFDNSFSGAPSSNTVNVYAGNLLIGTYVSNVLVDTTFEILATNLASAINLNGYSATASYTTITVKAPYYSNNSINGTQITIQII